MGVIKLSIRTPHEVLICSGISQACCPGNLELYLERIRNLFSMADKKIGKNTNGFSIVLVRKFLILASEHN